MPVWDDEWMPIATNGSGDVIIINDGNIYEVQHDTGVLEPVLITKDVGKLCQLMKGLAKYKGYSEDDSIETLKEVKQTLKELKKQAPRSLKYDFELEIEDIQDTISDKRWLKTKAGQFMQELKDYTKLVYPELRKNGRYADVMIFRHVEKKIFIVGGWLKDNESVDEVKRIIAKYPSPYPVEYGEFKPYDED